MQAHFSSFTPEAMRALGDEFAAGAERRRALLDETRRHTSALLAGFRAEHAEAEEQRRQRAARDADARRVFMSELRSGVHSLRNRFELARRETALDLREMARELRAAREAFRGRRSPGGAGFRGAARSWQKPAEPDHGSYSGFERDESTRLGSSHGPKPGSSKRRHG